MSTSLQLSSHRARTGLYRSSARTETAIDSDRRPNLWRYLPLVLLVTSSVIVLPAMLSAALIPQGSAALVVLSMAVAVASSVGLASIEASAWKRRPGSSDVVFADLMLWGWVRRCLAEGRLARAQALYDGARRAGPSISIELLTSLSTLLLSRDAYTQGHSERVARRAERIARTMHLAPVDVAKVRTAAAVHDVGKLYTPREILNNPSRLSEAEFDVMKRHAADGATMLSGVGDPEIADMVRHHHERIDGTGYPDGLSGAQIPLGARIIAVADTFDSITSSRAYRSAGTQKKALEVLSGEAGAQLDGAAVAAFIDDYSARRPVAWLTFATAALQRGVAAVQASSTGVAGTAGGIGSVLPALGAAGLLSLSPALHRDAGTTRATHIARAPGTTISRAPSAGAAPGPRLPIARVRPPSAGRDGARRLTRAPRGPAFATPNSPLATPNPTLATGSREGGGAPGPPRAPSVPSPPRPPSPLGGSPSLPPAIAPVTVPSLSTPSVSTPAASVPSITTPSVSTPVVTDTSPETSHLLLGRR